MFRFVDGHIRQVYIDAILNYTDQMKSKKRSFSLTKRAVALSKQREETERDVKASHPS